MSVNFYWIFFFIFQLQCARGASGPSPLKFNLVTTFINQVFTRLGQGVSIPDISLGDTIGGLSEVKVKVSEDAAKSLDGVGQFGFKLNASIPEVAISGRYDIEYLDVPNLFPLFGRGNFSISLRRVDLNVRLIATYDMAQEKFDLDFQEFGLSLNESLVIFENLMEDPPLADFLNQLVSALLPTLTRILMDSGILQILKPITDFYLNGIILCIKKEFLTGKVYECIWNLFQTEDFQQRIAMVDFKPFYHIQKSLVRPFH